MKTFEVIRSAVTLCIMVCLSTAPTFRVATTIGMALCCVLGLMQAWEIIFCGGEHA